jgi:hypothetical protein
MVAAGEAIVDPQVKLLIRKAANGEFQVLNGENLQRKIR